MNKLTLKIASIIALLQLSTFSYADNEFSVCSIMTPYIGVDARINNLDFKSKISQWVTKDSIKSLNVFAGIKFNNYFGFEFGAHTGNSDKFKGKLHGFHASIQGYFPVYNDINLVGSAGLSHLQMSMFKDWKSANKLIPMLSLGLQAPIADTLSMRGQAIWHNSSMFKSLNASTKVRNTVGYSLGLIYHF